MSSEDWRDFPVSSESFWKHVVQESKPCIFNFHIFQKGQKTEYFLLGVSIIEESLTGLYLVTSQLSVVAVFEFPIKIS